MNGTRRSRREFVQISGMAAGAICLGALLQACGGGSSPSPAASPPAPAQSASPAEPAGSASAASPAASVKPAGSSAVAASPASATAKAGVPKLIVAYGAIAGSFAPLWMANNIGAFDKHGISVDMRYIENNVAVSAMVAKSIDVLEASAAPILTVDANGKEDLVYIASALNHPHLGMYAAASITNAEQLRGQIIASDKPGTPVDYAARLSLSLMGLKPSDVQLRPIGGVAEVLAAMLSGQVPAGVVAPPQSFQAEAKGFHLLQSIFSRPYQNVGLVVKRSRLDELASALRSLLAAYRDGILAWNSQPEAAMKVLDQYAKVGDADILKRTYDFYAKTALFEPSLEPTMEGIQAMIEFLASSTVPALQGAKPEQFVDTRFLKDLPKA